MINVPTARRPGVAGLAIALALLGCAIAPLAAAKIKIDAQYVRNGKAVELHCTDEATGKEVACPEARLKKELGMRPVEIAFSGRDFAELDAIFDRVSSGQQRFADGDSYLDTYEEALAGHMRRWQRWDAHLEEIKQWQKERPGSNAAKFAEAVYWRTSAWNARGEGYAASVAPDSWKLFAERLAKAGDSIDQLKPIAKQFPAWYEFKMNLALETGNPEQVRAIFDEGVAIHRDYYRLYLVMGRAYDPKWGGDPAAFERFANEAVRLARGFEGRGMYGRLFWSVDNVHGLPLMGPKSVVPSWPKLNAAFADLVKHHPDSFHILNRYASIACRANDAVLYRKLRTRLGDYLDERHFDVVAVDVCDSRFHWQAPAAKF